MRTKEIIANYMQVHECSRATAFRHLKKSQQFHNSETKVSKSETKGKESHETDETKIETNETPEVRLLMRLIMKENETLKTEIKELKSLVINGFKAILNNEPFETKIETLSETLETPATLSLDSSSFFLSSSIDSNTTKESHIEKESNTSSNKEESSSNKKEEERKEEEQTKESHETKKGETKTKKDNKAEPRKRKSIKELVETKAIEATEVHLFKTHIFDRYPKRSQIIKRFDDSLRAFSELSKEEKQELFDNMDNVIEFYEVNKIWVTNLVSFIKERKWQTFNYNFNKNLNAGEELLTQWKQERDSYGIKY